MLIYAFVLFAFYSIHFTDNETTASVTTPTLTSPSTGNVGKNSTSAGSVLHRVISLTATHADNMAKVSKPAFVPEKLHFSAYEKFEGKSLVQTDVNGLRKCSLNVVN